MLVMPGFRGCQSLSGKGSSRTGHKVYSGIGESSKMTLQEGRT